jgi:hypothetical protein
MGFYGQDQGMRGRVIDYDCPIEFSNKVLVNPDDVSEEDDTSGSVKPYLAEPEGIPDGVVYEEDVQYGVAAERGGRCVRRVF